jgi:hypothetical protein
MEMQAALLKMKYADLLTNLGMKTSILHIAFLPIKYEIGETRRLFRTTTSWLASLPHKIGAQL